MTLRPDAGSRHSSASVFSFPLRATCVYSIVGLLQEQEIGEVHAKNRFILATTRENGKAGHAARMEYKITF
jgi:hypothetical protein